jgi:replication factor A1
VVERQWIFRRNGYFKEILATLPRYSHGYGRGRRRGENKLYFEPLFSIVQIASKYDIEPKLLVESFIKAWNSKDVHCGRLKIRCRGVIDNENSNIFLVTCEGKVVAQFPIKTEVLENTALFKNHLRQIPIQEIRERYNRKDTRLKKTIGQLRYQMKKVDLKAKIIEMPPAIRVMTRFGHRAKVTNIKIADDTGSIRLSLWNNQMDNLYVGDVVDIENSYVARYRGELQLRLGRKGTINNENVVLAPMLSNKS